MGHSLVQAFKEIWFKLWSDIGLFDWLSDFEYWPVIGSLGEVA